MRILVISHKFPPPLEGGAWVYLHNLISRYEADEVVVFTNSRPGDGDFDKLQRYRTVRSRVKVEDYQKLAKIRLWLIWFFELMPLLRSERFDLIHIGNLFPSGVIGWLYSKILKVPYILFTYAEELNIQNVPGRATWSSRLRDQMCAKIIRDAAGHVAVSEYTIDLLGRWGIPRDKAIKVVPMVTPPAALASGSAGKVRQRLGLGESEAFVLCAGRLIERKGQDRLIQAWSAVLRSYPLAKLVIVGRGPESDRLQSMAEDLGVSRSLVFTGFVSDEELAEHYAACDIFVMTHRETDDGDTEGCPTVFLEAGSYGKPVIGGSAGGVRDAILDGETGLIVDGTKPAEIAEALIGLLRSPACARGMGERGRRRVLEALTPEKGAAAVMRFSRRVLELGGGC